MSLDVRTSVKMPKVDVTLKYFFDREIVMQAVGAAQARVMAESGHYVMRAARRSIKSVEKQVAKIQARAKAGEIDDVKRRKLLATQNKPSAAGSPPKSRTGLLKDYIFFAYDSVTGAVFVGPAKLRAKKDTQTVPALLEYGGDFDGMGIEGTGEWYTSDGVHRQRFKQVKAQRHMPARPYMKPALDNSEKGLARIWADSIKRGRA
jgi:hypothetical protein